MSHESRIVFFGSGPVAAKSLELLAQNFEIEAVVTKPKPAHHRGNFPVLDVAETLKLPVHTVSNKTELSTLMLNKPFTSTTGVLIDFGIIVAQDTIDYFPKGIVNSHFSVLPDLRGADPITFAILSGQKTTGVSLMLLVEAMDEGPLLSFGEYELPADITAPVLTERLINFSNELLKSELPRYMNEPSKPADQNITGRTVSYSRKLMKEDGRLDFTKPAAVLEREIRGYIEWPKSYTVIADKDVIVTKAHVAEPRTENSEPRNEIGEGFKTADGELAIQTADGLLIIDSLKPGGKKEMTAKEFLSGYGKDI